MQCCFVSVLSYLHYFDVSLQVGWRARASDGGERDQVGSG